MYMKNIKTFEGFLSSDYVKSSLLRLEIFNICRKYGIKNYTVNKDGTIDVNGDVDLHRRGLTELPLKFNKVSGDFYCFENNLKSFDGFPKEIGKNIDVSDNNIKSFDGFPEKIGVSFFCTHNPINELWRLFKDKSKMELFIYNDIIRDNNIIILDRLNDFLDQIGSPPVTEVKGYKCI